MNKLIRVRLIRAFPINLLTSLLFTSFWLFIDDYVISFLFLITVLSKILLIYAYILCNFQCTTQSVNSDNKIVEDNLLIQDSFNNRMIDKCY